CPCVSNAPKLSRYIHHLWWPYLLQLLASLSALLPVPLTDHCCGGKRQSPNNSPLKSHTNRRLDQRVHVCVLFDRMRSPGYCLPTGNCSDVMVYHLLCGHGLRVRGHLIRFLVYHFSRHVRIFYRCVPVGETPPLGFVGRGLREVAAEVLTVGFQYCVDAVSAHSFDCSL